MAGCRGEDTGEGPVQLRERARYGYRVIGGAGAEYELKEGRGIAAGLDPNAPGAAVSELLLALDRRRGNFWQGLYRRSPDPRVLGLADLWKARL